MHITAFNVMTESILNHPQETFENHANHERIPVQIYLDSREACQVIGDEIIQQINQRSAGQADQEGGEGGQAGEGQEGRPHRQGQGQQVGRLGQGGERPGKPTHYDL